MIRNGRCSKLFAATRNIFLGGRRRLPRRRRQPGMYVSSTSAITETLEPKVMLSVNTLTPRQVTEILEDTGAQDDEYGFAIAMDSGGLGTFAVVGAYGDNFETGAAYILQKTGDGDPSMPDSWTQVTKLTAADGAIFDRFGYSVDIDVTGTGVNVVIGSYQDDGAFDNTGSAYFFNSANGTTGWTQISKVTAGGLQQENADFGFAVAIDGNYALVGAPRDDVSGFDTGSAYLFQFNGGNWVADNAATGTLNQFDGVNQDGANYGFSVDLIADSFFNTDGMNENIYVIGAPGEDNGRGAVYAYEPTGSQRTIPGSNPATQEVFNQAIRQTTRLTGFDSGDAFGWAVNITDTLSSVTYTTAAIEVDGVSPTENINVPTRDNFRGRLVVGAPLSDANGVDAGRAYVYQRTFSGNANLARETSEISWSQVTTLNPSDPQANARFGTAVAIDSAVTAGLQPGHRIAVGAPEDDAAGLDSSGAVYIYDEIFGAGPVQVSKLVPVDGEAQEKFGFSVTLINNDVVIGTPLDDDTADEAGSVYVFDLLNLQPVLDDEIVFLDENSADGTLVIDLNATDPNILGDVIPERDQTLTYSIVSGNGLGAFAIDSVTGEITVVDMSVLDFETNPVIQLTVRATDNGFIQKRDNATIRINLRDINDQPVLPDAQFTIDENSPDGTFVGSVTASDQDVGDTITYTIEAGNVGNAFAIDGVTGEITVNDMTALDFETTPQFVLTVRATDDGTPNEFDDASVTIDLNDINENPIVDDQTFSVDENSPNATVVGTVVNTDPDAGDSWTYQITAGNTGTTFAIDNNGVITVADNTLLNFETNPTFVLSLLVTDAGGLSDTADITINLNDVNDAPVVDDQTFNIDENSPNGTTVAPPPGIVVATDEDLPAQTLTYVILSGNDGATFAIDSATGEITVNDETRLDFETTPSYTLLVQVTDDGSPNLSDTALITINVNDQPDIVADIGDFVWHDLDADGIQDAGEPGVPNLIVELWDPGADGLRGGGDDSLVTTTVTDDTGYYQFANIVPQNRAYLRFVAAPGVVYTLANQGVDDAVDSDVDANGFTSVFLLPQGGDLQTWDAGVIFELATIGDRVWMDDNFNGVLDLDLGERGVKDIEVVLWTPGADGNEGTADDVEVARTLTNKWGVYRFEDQVPGNFFVEFITPEGIYLTHQNRGNDLTVDSNPNPQTGLTSVFTMANGEVDLTIDAGLRSGPAQIVRLTSDDGETTDQFGHAVSVYSDPFTGRTYAIVGAYGEDNERGAAYIYEKVAEGNPRANGEESQDLWVLRQRLTASDGAAEDRFGFSVDIGITIDGGDPDVFGDETRTWTAIVGAYQDDSDTGSEFDNTGSVYVFDLFGSTWTQTDKILPLIEQENSDFGISIAFDGDKMLIGAPRDDFNGIDVGSATLMEYRFGSWNFQDLITNDFRPFDFFGRAVDIIAPDVNNNWNQDPNLGNEPPITGRDLFDEVLLIGAPGSDTGGENAGSVFVYEWSTLNSDGGRQYFYRRVDELQGSDTAAGDRFGSSIAIRNDLTQRTIAGISGVAFVRTETRGHFVIGAPGHDGNGVDSGAAYSYYRRIDNNGFDTDKNLRDLFYDEETKLTASDAAEGDLFGTSVAITQSITGGVEVNERIVVGAPGKDNGPINNPGAAYVYDIVFFGVPQQVSKLLAPEQDDFDSFGFSVAVDNDDTIIGAPLTDDFGDESGRAYMFDLFNRQPIIDDQNVFLKENSPNGTNLRIATNPMWDLRFRDFDLDQGVVYSIVPGTESAPGAFTIDPTNGDLIVANSSLLDFETTPIFTLRIAAQDDGLIPERDEADIIINLIDVFESRQFAIDENSPNGTFVGNVVFAAQGTPRPSTFAIVGGNTGNAFRIEPRTGDIYVNNVAAVNFEVNPVFVLDIRRTKDNDPGNPQTTQFRIDLNDINERPIVGNQSFSVEENSPPGTIVGTIVNTDPDVFDTTWNYQITAGNTGGAFTVNSTGVITVVNPGALDFETKASFTLDLLITDAGGLTDTALITVNLINVNDPPFVADQNFTIAENSAVGTTVGTVVASNVEASQTLTYAIVGGNPNNTFAINANTGVITVADATLLDYETATQLTFVVQVTDNGTPNRSDTGNITVAITDVSETPARIGNFVWQDLDADGIQDAGEPGAPNIVVQLFNPGVDGIRNTADDVFIAQRTTGVDGSYEFANVNPSNRGYLRFVLPSGVSFTAQDQGGNDALDSDADAAGYTAIFDIPQGAVLDTLDAGVIDSRLVTIGDRVWIDTNQNGLQEYDQGEKGARNVEVILFAPGADGLAGTADDVEQDRTTTNKFGIYRFTGRLPGAYFVQIVAPAGQTFTAPFQGANAAIDSNINPATGRTNVFFMADGQTDLTRDGGLVPLQEGRIGNFVWSDTDADGVQDSGEPGIRDVRVNLWNAGADGQIGGGDDFQAATTLTSKFGAYEFSNVGPGNYYIEVIAPTGYEFTQARQGNWKFDSDINPNGLSDVFVQQPGETDLTRDAGLVRPPAGTVGDRVWRDANGNGVQDDGEVGVSGVSVQLWSPGADQVSGNGDDVLTLSTTTAANGTYIFNDVPEGRYYVQFVAPTGLRFTRPGVGTPQIDSDADPNNGRTTSFQITPDRIELDIDAGLVSSSLGSIGNFVWNDLNRNGSQNSGEPGIANVGVSLWTPGADNTVGTGDDFFVASTLTAANGAYSFTGLTEGDYFLKFARPNGFNFTLKNAGNWKLDSDANQSNGWTDILRLTPGKSDLTRDVGLVSVAPVASQTSPAADPALGTEQAATVPVQAEAPVAMPAVENDDDDTPGVANTGDSSTDSEVDALDIAFSSLSLDEIL